MLLLLSYSHEVIAQEQKKVAPPAKEEKLVTKPSPGDPPPPTKIVIIEEPQDQDNKAPIFTVVEKMPEFPGGQKAMYKYLGENIKYPQKAKENGIQGTVFISYVIEKDGSVSHAKILRGVEKSLDKEAIRVVTGMPKWKPGKQRGEAVRVQYNLPIKFTLDDKKEKKAEQ